MAELWNDPKKVMQAAKVHVKLTEHHKKLAMG